ncbi:MAG: hypothetical protein JNK60_02040 [Acidobacteria bacterium]|nr:hypothetical protein [Acidobacteriota bacterium]
MIEFPPIPSWDAMHPLIVHFPVALLLVVPLFLVLGGALELREARRGRPYLMAALVLLVLGTVATFVAIETGEAAGKVTERSAALSAVLERHESLAETTRTVFTVLSVTLAAILLVPRAFRRELPRAATVGLLAVFTLSYGAGAVLLANTAHNGGRLVHEMGSSPAMASAATAQMPGVSAPDKDQEDSDD